MRGISLISGVLFTAFLISATAIVYWTAVPVIQKMQCAATLDKMKSTFSEIDRNIQTVASEGEGSRRTIDLSLDSGEIHVSADSDTIYWTHECDAPVFSPRTFQAFGNVILGSNLDAMAYESQCLGRDAFVIENQHISACFMKVGSEGNSARYNVSDVLLSVYQKDTNTTMPLEYLEITLDENSTSSVGEGYTTLTRSGMNLPFGEVTAYMESDYGVVYRIRFVLESGEDFLIIRGE